MVGMDVRLEDPFDGVAMFGHEFQDLVRRGRGDFVRGRIEVEDGVDYDGITCLGVGNNVLPGAGLALKRNVDLRLVLLFSAHRYFLVVEIDRYGQNEDRQI